MSRPPSTVKFHPAVVPLVLANAGVLFALFFGPNAAHEFLPAAYGGAALAVIGFLLVVRAIVVRRRAEQSVTERRG